MPVFQLNPIGANKPQLQKAVEDSFAPEDRYQLPNEAGWLVRYDGTTVELCNFIKLTGQEQGVPSPVGSTLVTLVTSYYGRGPTDMWEWLSLKMS